RGFLIILLGTAVAVVGGDLHYTKDPTHLVWLPPGIDPWPVPSSYIGGLTLGALFPAPGPFVRTPGEGRGIAALTSIPLGIPFILPVLFLSDMDPSGWPYRVAAFITVPHHFGRDFTRGVLDTRHLVLYVSVALLFLFLTVRSVESQRR